MTAHDAADQPGMDAVRRRLAVARGDEPADLVLKGGRVLSVFTGEVFDADVAIRGEHIAGLGSYHARRETDVRGQILVPGLLDAHMHLESTKLMVDQFARAVLPHGTTTVFIDPHEVANVFGLRGVRALVESASVVPLDYYVMVPSCVPASRFESSGATVTAAEIGGFLRERADVIGLAEVMDFPGVVAGDPEVLAKIGAARAAASLARTAGSPETTPGKSITSASPMTSARSRRNSPISAAVTVAPLASNRLAGTHEGTRT